MKKSFLLLLIMLFLSPAGYSETIPVNLKKFLENKFSGISFKIDNSFVLNGETFLPLIPPITKDVKKVEIIEQIQDKTTPKLLWFSNDWIFVKVIEQDDKTKTIIDLNEVPSKYREQFLKAKFPDDLVVPKELIVKEELSVLIGKLPITLKKQEANLRGILYLTSPDSGKIIYLNLSNPKIVNHIQTNGAPWEISYDKTNKLLFITDFAKDQIHQLKPNEKTILKSLSLESMSSPKDIELSSDGSLAYILESLSNDFAVYKIHEEKYFIKTKLPPNPTSFSLSKELNLVTVTCPNTNSVAFLNTNDFSLLGQIMVDGGPEKVIEDSNSKIIYTANRNGHTISSIDLENKKIKNTVEVGDTPVSLALSPTRNFLYVGNGKSNTISIVNLYTNKLEDVIALPLETQFPGDIEITTDGKWLITTSETTNTISVIDLTTNKVAGKLDVGATTHSAHLIQE